MINYDPAAQAIGLCAILYNQLVAIFCAISPMNFWRIQCFHGNLRWHTPTEGKWYGGRRIYYILTYIHNVATHPRYFSARFSS